MSVATVYPGPTVAAWVDGPVDVPATLFDAGTIVAMQSEHVEGEADAIEEISEQPLWAGLPAVEADRVFTVDRLGYPGIAGRIRLVDDLVAMLGA